MLRFFRSISADEAEQQSAAALKCSAEQQSEASQLQQKAELLKRGPGRPKKLTDAQHVLAMATAASAEDNDAVEPAQKRGKYANWFASVYIHDILHAVQRTGSARKAVEWLQRSFPKLPTESAARFSALSESTVRTWYKDGKLLPKFQQLLDEQKAAAPRGRGKERALAAHPEAEERVKQILYSKPCVSVVHPSTSSSFATSCVQFFWPTAPICSTL
jgi:lipopolysaccharide biosynthesis regulator YciM